MKKLATLVILAVFSVGMLAAADKVEGLWKSIDEKDGKVTATWKIYQKNGTLFGEIINVPNQADTTLAVNCKGPYKDFPVPGDVSKMTVINTPFIFGLKMKTPGQWEGGNIIDPGDGKMYKCKVTYRPADGKKFKTENLEMRGEIGMGIGRSQFWERATDTEVAALGTKK
jgi:uncharacterized protein (DUF2147 family)